ncbi:K+-dependent Na+/Ca+ exchanger related-protein [Rhodopseudomonas palustris HaA2]|uniref:K+-dependent Na+/Ca+ exchanger related-protein n=1 Tax=Rhodopseudomonas palustris (strain HaA2) TaxID=316058 RepID=Q2IXF1_RHOP2|nr:calcium/sodium antiporter [Rhodopseudomonas palustris]ABD07109.1 K+-dependent Na+/Ca+ exchanger related-protein [Rhodopseudomonas palustris HaA2]
MLTLLSFLLGLVALVVGAELLVRGASKLALTFGISPLVVGLTVVAFGTSSPELAVSIQAAMSNQADITIGNVVGSNILNVLFILGLSALITPLIVNRQLIRQEVPIMVGASLLLAALAWDGNLSRVDGLILIGLMAAYTAFLIVQSRRQETASDEAAPTTADAGTGWDSKLPVQIALIIVGLILLVIGATFLVEAAVTFAKLFGVSEMVIGLTIVAAGTSLPEVATSIMAAIRGQRDIAVGNVVGSNTFNILGVLGLSAGVAPDGLNIAPAMMAFDIPVMVAVAIACLPIFFTGSLIARWEGGLFLALYVAYTVYLVMAAQQHDGLSTYGFVLGTVVLPLCGLTLVVISWREWRARH